MSDEVGTNLVGAGQLVTCGTGFFSLAGKSGYSPRALARRRPPVLGTGCTAASSLAFGGVLSAVDVSDATLLSICDSS